MIGLKAQDAAVTSSLLHAKLRRAVPYLLEASIMSCQ